MTKKDYIKLAEFVISSLENQKRVNMNDIGIAYKEIVGVKWNPTNCIPCIKQNLKELKSSLIAYKELCSECSDKVSTITIEEVVDTLKEEIDVIEDKVMIEKSKTIKTNDTTNKKTNSKIKNNKKTSSVKKPK